MNQTKSTTLPALLDWYIRAADSARNFELLELRLDNAKLRKAVDGLESEAASLRAENARLEARWAAMKAYVAQLGGPTK